MKTTLLLLALLSLGCRDMYKPYERPFVIISKAYYPISCASGQMGYYYQDANGYTKFFCEERDAYSIGDTLK